MPLKLNLFHYQRNIFHVEYECLSTNQAKQSQYRIIFKKA